MEKRCTGAGKEGQWTRAHPVDVKETEAALTGLQPGREYQFRVKAINALGWSPPSPESSPYRLPFNPDKATRPSFMTGLRDVTVMEHEKVEFRVEVTGMPMPSVQWSVNDSGIFSSRMRVLTDEEGASSGISSVSTLVLDDVLAADDGEVKCVAVNELGQTTTAAFLNVEGEKALRDNLCD